MNLDISTEEGLAIATALRGPDAAWPTLKYVITDWVRGACGASPDDCDVRSGQVSEGTIVKLEGLVEYFYKDKTQSDLLLPWVRASNRALDYLVKSSHEGRWLSHFTWVLADMLAAPTPMNREAVQRCIDYYDEPQRVEKSLTVALGNLLAYPTILGKRRFIERLNEYV